jgi:hypothetical protein
LAGRHPVKATLRLFLNSFQDFVSLPRFYVRLWRDHLAFAVTERVGGAHFSGKCRLEAE